MKKKSFHRLVNLGVEFGSRNSSHSSDGAAAMMALEEEKGSHKFNQELSKTLGGGRLPFPLNNNKQTATLINYTLE